MKDRQESMDRVSGLFNITVTPFQADGQLDLAAVSETVERVLDAGYEGLLIGGTYGEFAAMSTEERGRLFRHAMEVVADRVPVLLCTAHSDDRIVRELTVLASELGGLPMVTAPYVSEVTDAQIVSYFNEIAPLSRTGIMVYNAPGIGITLTPEVIEQLAGIEGVVGLKQGDLNPAVVDRLASRVVGRIRVLAASDLVFLGPLAAGFDGLSSTNSCALPEIILASFGALRAGDATRAGMLHRSWYPLRAVARALGQPQTTKAAMTLRGWAGGHVRLPLRDLDDTARAKVAEALAATEAQSKDAGRMDI
jgi:4-hydroxy-tetrahydrodipicolinate synthase